MSTCSRCGQAVEFRYVDGRCIPLHASGGCGESAASSFRDFSGYSRSEESSCFKTRCPVCDEPVFFIRYNGGSVWIDPPLGPPWFKHGCMDTRSESSATVRNALLSDRTLAAYKMPEGLIIGVVSEAEVSFDGSFTLINLVTGESENFHLLVKNSAGFLVGRIVIYDSLARSVKWLENDVYAFLVIAPVRVPDAFELGAQHSVDCPDCGVPLRVKNLGRHLRQVHGYSVI